MTCQTCDSPYHRHCPPAAPTPQAGKPWLQQWQSAPRPKDVLDALRLVENAAARPCGPGPAACGRRGHTYLCPSHRASVRIAVRRLRGNQFT